MDGLIDEQQMDVIIAWKMDQWINRWTDNLLPVNAFIKVDKERLNILKKGSRTG